MVRLGGPFSYQICIVHERSDGFCRDKDGWTKPAGGKAASVIRPVRITAACGYRIARYWEPVSWRLSGSSETDASCTIGRRGRVRPRSAACVVNAGKDRRRVFQAHT